MGSPSAYAQSWQWATSLGDGECYSTAVDAAGNIYVTGKFEGAATFGSTTLISDGITDVFVAKLNSSGMVQWVVQAGGNSRDEGSGLAVDGTGNVLVTGYFLSNTAVFGTTTLTSAGGQDVFVAKLTTAGVWQWAASMGGAYSENSGGVAVDGSGSVIITGEFNSPTATFGPTMLTNSGGTNMFVVKLTQAGAWQWAVSAGGGGNDASHDVAIDGSGDIIVTGGFNSHTINFGPTTLTNTIGGGSDIYVAKISTAGVWQWATSAGGNNEEKGLSLAVDGGNNVYVGGGFNSLYSIFGPIVLTNTSASGSTNDVFVAKLTQAGAWQWAASAGGSINDFVSAISVDGNGSVIITGWFSSPSATFGATTLTNPGSWDWDVFVAKLTQAGAWQWAVSVGGSNDDYSYDVVTDNSSNALVSGHFTSPTAVFGPITVTNTGGGYSIFIARLSATTGLSESAATPTFTLAPNPAYAAVTLTGASGSTATLFDTLGRVVRTVLLTDGAATLDVRGLPAGLYVVRAGSAARRLVVE